MGGKLSIDTQIVYDILQHINGAMVLGMCTSKFRLIQQRIMLRNEKSFGFTTMTNDVPS